MKVTRLHLIRHGLTQGNIDGIYMGNKIDLPLCAEGKAQLEELKSLFTYPNVQTVFSSPLVRAVESAEVLFPGAEHKIVLPDLRENDFGEFSGRKIKELVHDENFKHWMDPTSGYTPKGGENGPEFHLRCATTLLKMFEYMMQANITEAACVTHGGVIMSMMAQCAVPQRPADMWLADNGCGYTLLCTPQMLMRDRVVEASAVVPTGYFKDEPDAE